MAGERYEQENQSSKTLKRYEWQANHKQTCVPLEDYKAISPVFENDIYEAISMRTCVEKRMTIGAPGPDVMEKVIAENKKYLEEN